MEQRQCVLAQQIIQLTFRELLMMFEFIIERYLMPKHKQSMMLVGAAVALILALYIVGSLMKHQA
jgi:hypothetical protein